MTTVELPSSEELWEALVHLQGFSPRTPGSPELRSYVQYMAEEFAVAGLEVQRDTYVVPDWRPLEWSLSVDSANGVEVVETSYVYPSSGTTGPDGVRAELVHLGPLKTATVDAASVAGRIVVVDYPLELAPFGYDDVWAIVGATPEELPTTWGFGSQNVLALEQLRREAAAAGALGFVAAWLGVSEDAIRGQHQPILPPSVQQLHADHAPEGGAGTGHFELPALWVGPAAREQLVSAAQASAEATLLLFASVDPEATTDTLIATLPGTSDETIVLITHSDGVNAIQENGVVGMVALARAFAKLPLAQRKRTLVFIPAAAHLATRVYDASTGEETLAEAEGAIAEHPGLATDTVAVIAFEHFGTTEWVDDGERFYATGRDECAHVLTASSFLAETVTKRLTESGAGPACVANSRLWGMSYPFGVLGIPAISYGSAPLYLQSTASDGNLDKISPQRFHAELRAIADTITDVDGATSEELSA